jgi:hypothetical protein
VIADARPARPASEKRYRVKRTRLRQRYERWRGLYTTTPARPDRVI